MKTITIRDQEIDLQFTPGPWDNFIYGHITSHMNGKIIANLVSQDDQSMPWALQCFSQLRANTQLLISLAPTMLVLLAQMLELMSIERDQSLFTISEELKSKFEVIVIQAAGGVIDQEEAFLVSQFMHHVALDQSLIIEHLGGPWQLFDSGKIRFKQLCLANVCPSLSLSIPWAAIGDQKQILANQHLIVMTLPLAVSFMTITQAFKVELIHQIDRYYRTIIEQAFQLVGRITVPNMTTTNLAA